MNELKQRSVLQAKRLGTVDCRATDPLAKIAKCMADDDISGLVVTDEDGYLVGIITRSDILRAGLESPDWRTEPAAHYMTRDVVTVTPEAKLEDVMHLLLGRHIHRVVVITTDQGRPRPIAVISDSDLVIEMVDTA